MDAVADIASSDAGPIALFVFFDRMYDQLMARLLAQLDGRDPAAPAVQHEPVPNGGTVDDEPATHPSWRGMWTFFTIIGSFAACGVVSLCLADSPPWWARWAWGRTFLLPGQILFGRRGAARARQLLLTCAITPPICALYYSLLLPGGWEGVVPQLVLAVYASQSLVWLYLFLHASPGLLERAFGRQCHRTWCVRCLGYEFQPSLSVQRKMESLA
ncbi:hypothetical protein AURDEDRAFT_116177 [Auricularia subglabra TFB-10046 SS5]|nr:hypothetical protein AURDEDRAFT_116177 [Auricularia subglabra TFB-10046 SS5]